MHFDAARPKSEQRTADAFRERNAGVLKTRLLAAGQEMEALVL
jgi:hypothetical protein